MQYTIALPALSGCDVLPVVRELVAGTDLMETKRRAALCAAELADADHAAFAELRRGGADGGLAGASRARAGRRREPRVSRFGASTGCALRR